MSMKKTVTISILFVIGIVLLLSLSIQSSADGSPDFAMVGDTVWYDMNMDGIQDRGEPGIEGVTVTLYYSDDSFYAERITNETGKYLFDFVPAYTDFYINFELPDGYVFSPQHQGIDPEKDSDANVTTGETEVFSLIADEIDLSWDAGMYQSDPDVDIEKWVKDTATDQWVKQIQTTKNIDILFRIVLTNTGNVPLHELTITDVLSQQLSYAYQSSLPPSSASNNQIIWHIQMLFPDESIEIIYSAKTVNYCQGTNTVEVTTSEEVSDDDIVYVKVQNINNNPPLLELHHPTGGEIVKGTLTIEWYAIDSGYRNQEDLPIYLYYKKAEMMDDSFQKIAEKLPNTGIYNWSTSEIENGEYQIHIVAQNKQNGIAHKTSKPFTILSTLAMITNISIERIIETNERESSFIRTGDNVRILASLEHAEKINSSEISANLSALGKKAEVPPDSVNETTAVWMITNVTCHTSEEAHITITIKDHDERSEPIQMDPFQPKIRFITPENGVYLFNKRILPSEKTIIFGTCTFTLTIEENCNVEKVEFYIDENIYQTKTAEPYSITVHDRVFGKHDITIVAYDTAGNSEQVSRTVQIYKIFNRK